MTGTALERGAPDRTALPVSPLATSRPVERRADPGLTDHAFARAAGSMPIDGNSVRLLQDAQQNFPAWLAAIRGAEQSIQFEN